MSAGEVSRSHDSAALRCRLLSSGNRIKNKKDIMQSDVSSPVSTQGAHDHCNHDHEGVQGKKPVDLSALVSLRELSLSRGGRQILRNVNFDLRAGEIVTLIGPNGAGKTTLVRLILGLMRPDKGDIYRKSDLVIGYAPQRFDIDRAMPLTVKRFLTLGRQATEHECAAILNEVGASGLAGRQLADLSGGELQRVVLARALLRNPHLLVLDEPVRGVDFSGEADLYRLIGAIRDRRGVAVLLVSHDLHVVMAQADWVICLNGHVCCSGVPQRVQQHPEYARLFGPVAAGAIGIYQHHHDHSHDLTGAPVPLAPADNITKDVNPDDNNPDSKDPVPGSSGGEHGKHGDNIVRERDG